MERRLFRLKAWEIILALLIVVFLISGATAQKTQAALSEKVVRLHVLANSDTVEDQNLKLKVRDVILTESEALLASAQTREDAAALLRGQLLELENLAAETVHMEGYDYPVTVELTKTEFPTKTYEGFSLPAGEYLSLRILIGNAIGQNWWCVVFPPLCTALAAEVSEIASEAGLSKDEVAFITEESPKYVLKFKLLELF